MSYFEISNVEQGIRAERHRQVAKWGQQNHPDGTGPDVVWAFTGPASYVAGWAKETCDHLAEEGHLTWRDILTEEVAEAYAEEDPAKLREELLQVASVAVAWIEAIDRRTPSQGVPSADERLVDGPNGGC